MTIVIANYTVKLRGQLQQISGWKPGLIAAHYLLLGLDNGVRCSAVDFEKHSMDFYTLIDMPIYKFVCEKEIMPIVY